MPLASAFSSTSQMKPTSTPGMRLNIFACWAPRPLVPMTASTMRSLAPWACRLADPATPSPTVAAAVV